MTKADMKSLFEQVSKLEKERETLQKKMDALDGKLSGHIKDIRDNLGSGPFQFQGRQVTIRFRAKKDSDGNKTTEGTYFFVGSKSDVMVID